MNSVFARPGGDDLAPHRVRQGDVAARRRGPARRPPTRPSSSGAGRPRYSRAPLRTPRRRWWKKIGCVSRALLPQRTIRSVSSTSRYELVPPPAPKTVARPATEGACQVRLQLSMLLLPRTARENFWAAKLTSLVALVQLKIPNGRSGPCAVAGGPEPGDGPVERLVPGRGAELAALRRRGRAAGSGGRRTSAWMPTPRPGPVGRGRWPGVYRHG